MLKTRMGSLSAALSGVKNERTGEPCVEELPVAAEVFAAVV